MPSAVRRRLADHEIPHCRFHPFLQHHHDQNSTEPYPGPVYQVHIFAAYLFENMSESVVPCYEIFLATVGLCFWESDSYDNYLL